MGKLIGHVDIELVNHDEKKYKKVTIQGADFVLEEGGDPIVKDGEKSTWCLFKYLGAGFDLRVDFVEIENRIFSYELKSEFIRDQFKSVTILEDELDFSN